MSTPVKGFSFFRLTDQNDGTHRNVCVEVPEGLDASAVTAHVLEKNHADAANTAVDRVHFAKAPKPLTFGSKYKELIVDAGWWNVFLVVFQIGLVFYCYFEIQGEKKEAQNYLDHFLGASVATPEAFFDLLETTNNIIGKNPEITQAIKRGKVLREAGLEAERDREDIASALAEDFATPGEKYLPTGYYKGSKFIPVMLGISRHRDKYVVKEYSVSPQDVDFKKAAHKEYHLGFDALPTFLRGLSFLSHKGKDNQQRTESTKNKVKLACSSTSIGQNIVGAILDLASAPPEEQGKKEKLSGAIIETLIFANQGEAIARADTPTIKPSSDPLSIILNCPIFNTDDKPVFLMHMMNHMLNCVLRNEDILDGKKKELYLDALAKKLATLEKKIEKAYGKKAAAATTALFKKKLEGKAVKATRKVVKDKEAARKGAFDKWVKSGNVPMEWKVVETGASVKNSSPPTVKIHQVPGFNDLRVHFNLGSLKLLCAEANTRLDKKEYLNAWKIASHTLHALPSIETIRSWKDLVGVQKVEAWKSLSPEAKNRAIDAELKEISTQLGKVSHYLMESKLKLAQTRMQTNEVLDSMNCTALMITVMRERIRMLGIDGPSLLARAQKSRVTPSFAAGMIAKEKRLNREQCMLLSLQGYTIPVEKFTQVLSNDLFLPLAVTPENQTKINKLKNFFLLESAGRKDLSNYGEEKNYLKDLYWALLGYEGKSPPSLNRNLVENEAYRRFENERPFLLERRDELLPSAMIDLCRQHVVAQILIDPQCYLFPIMGFWKAIKTGADLLLEAIRDIDSAADIVTKKLARAVKDQIEPLNRIDFKVSAVFSFFSTINLVDPTRADNATPTVTFSQELVKLLERKGTRRLHAPAHGSLPVPLSSSVLGRPSNEDNREDRDGAIPADKYRASRDFPVLDTETATEHALMSLLIKTEEGTTSPASVVQIQRLITGDFHLLENDLIQKRIAQILFLPDVLSSVDPQLRASLGEDLNRLIKQALEEKKIFTAAFLMFLLNKFNQHRFGIQPEADYKIEMTRALQRCKTHPQYSSLCLYYLDAFQDSPRADPGLFLNAYDQVVFAGPTVAIPFLQETLIPQIEADALPLLEDQIRDKEKITGGNKAALLPEEIVDNKTYRRLFGEEPFLAEKTFSNEENKFCYTWKVKGGYRIDALYSAQTNKVEFYMTINGKKHLHTEVAAQTERHLGKTLEHYGMWQQVDKPTCAFLIPALISKFKKENILVLTLDPTGKKLTHAQTLNRQTLFFDEGRKLLPYLGCVHEADLLLLKKGLSVSTVHFLHAPIHLDKDSNGNWIPQREEGGWKLWTEGTGPLLADLPFYGEFMLPFVHEEKGKEFVIFPNKIKSDLSFEKVPHFQSETFPLKINIDKKNQMSATHASLLYLAYVYFAKGDIPKAFLYLEACQNKGEFSAKEVEIFKRISRWFLEHPCKTTKSLAFQLKLELVLRTIQREQFHESDYFEDENDTYHRHLVHVLSLYKEYQQQVGQVPPELALTDDEVAEYRYLHLESFHYQLNKISRPPTSNKPVTSVFKPINSKKDLHPEFMAHLTVLAGPPVQKATMETLRELKLTMSDDILKHFWTIWTAVQNRSVTVANLAILIAPMPDDFTDSKLKEIIANACRLLFMQAESKRAPPERGDLSACGEILIQGLIASRGNFGWGAREEEADPSFDLSRAQVALTPGLTIEELRAVGSKKFPRELNAKRHQVVASAAIDELEKKEYLPCPFLRPEPFNPAAPPLPEFNHFEPVNEGALIRSIDEKEAAAVVFFETSVGAPETEEMTLNENAKITAGIRLAAQEMRDNVKNMRNIRVTHLIPLYEELEQTIKTLKAEALRAEIIKLARKEAKALKVELFAATNEEFDEAIFSRLLDLYEEGSLTNQAIVEKLTTFLYIATAKQQLEIALNLIPELWETPYGTDDYRDLSYKLYAQIQKGKDAARYTNNGTFEDNPFNRAFLVHEFKEKIILTQDQIRVIKNGALEELRMGKGKSSVIFPLAAKLIARERKHFPVVLFTEELLLQSKDWMDKRAYIFNFDRNAPISTQILQEEYLTLLKVKQKGRYAITTIECLADLRNKIIETHRKLIAHKDDDLAGQLHWMKKVFTFLHNEKTIYLADEIDQILSINSEKNYADGDQTPIDVNVFEAGDLVFKTILEDPALVAHLHKDSLSTLKDPQLTASMQSVAESLYDNEKFWVWIGGGIDRANVDKNHFAQYITGQSGQLPSGLPQKAEGAIAEKLDRFKHWLTKTMFTISKAKRRGIDYRLGPDGLTVVPVNKERELPNTKFGQEAEHVAYHFLWYIEAGPSIEGFKRVIGSIEAEAFRSATWRNWLDKLGPDENKRYEVLCKPENRELRILFLRYLMREKNFIMMYEKQIVCHVQDVAFGINIRGASGTVNHYALLNLFGMPRPVPRKITGETILKLNLEDPVTSFTNVLEQMTTVAADPHCKAIVNQAFSIPGKDTVDVIAYLRKQHKREYIFVHPQEKIQYIWRVNASIPVPLNKAKDVIDKKNCLFYFGPADTRGVHFAIPLGCYGAVFIGPTTTLPQKEQAEWRLRALGNGHGIKYFIQEEHALRIRNTVGRADIQVKHLLADGRDQTIVEESMNNFKAVAFTPTAILRYQLTAPLVEVNSSIGEDAANFKAVEDLFIHSKRMTALNDYMPSKLVPILERLREIYYTALVNGEKLSQNAPPRIQEALQTALNEITDKMETLDPEGGGREHMKYLKARMQYATSESGAETQIQEQHEIQEEEATRDKINVLDGAKRDKREKRGYNSFNTESFVQDKLYTLKDHRHRMLQLSHDFKQLFDKEMPSTGAPMGYLVLATNNQGEQKACLISDLDFAHLKESNNYTALSWKISVYMIQNGSAEVKLQGGLATAHHNPNYPLNCAYAKFLQGFLVYSPQEEAALKNWFTALPVNYQEETKNYIEKRHAPTDLIKKLSDWMLLPAAPASSPSPSDDEQKSPSMHPIVNATDLD